MKKISVLGGGFGGISAAIRLKARGNEVSIYERLNELGGRAQVFKKEGYLHDAGPTVITAPNLFYELFDLLGENLDDHLNLNRWTLGTDSIFHQIKLLLIMAPIWRAC